MKFRATSYSMGTAVAQVVVDASSYRSALKHPFVRALPAAGMGDRGRIRVLGIKVLR